MNGLRALLAVAALVGAIFYSLRCKRGDVYGTVLLLVALTQPGPQQDPVSGSIVIEKSDTDFAFGALGSIDLTIAGHTYGRAESGETFIGGDVLFGDVYGVTTIFGGTNDFLLRYNLTTG